MNSVVLLLAIWRAFASRAFYNPSTLYTRFEIFEKYSVFPHEVHESVLISIFLKERLMTCELFFLFPLHILHIRCVADIRNT